MGGENCAGNFGGKIQHLRKQTGKMSGVNCLRGVQGSVCLPVILTLGPVTTSVKVFISRK